MVDLTVTIDTTKAASRFKELKRVAETVTSGMVDDFEEVDVAIDEFSESIALGKKYVEELKKKYTDVSNALDKAPLGSKERALLRKELNEINAELKTEEEAIRSAEAAHQSNAQSYSSVRTQMTSVRNEMMQLELAGKQNSARYRELESELGRLGTAYRKVMFEQQALSTGATQWAGIQAGLQGVLGAFAAGQGVIGALTSDTEKFIKIQTRLQSVMGIIMGMTQMSNALHETSAFRIATLTKVSEVWNATNNKVATGLTRLGVSAGAASVAAKALTASLTMGLSVAISAAVAGISKLVTKYQETRKAAEEAAKAQRESFESYAESVASNASEAGVKFEALRQKYEALGDSLSSKRKFIADNAKAFEEIGVKVKTINDADNLFIKNADAFVASVELKARAAAAMDMAAQKYEESIKKMIEAENVGKITSVSRPSGARALYTATGLSEEQNQELNRIMREAENKRRREIMKGFGNRLPEGVSAATEIKEAGLEAGQAYIDGIKEGFKDASGQLDAEASRIIAIASGQQERAQETLEEAGIAPYPENEESKAIKKDKEEENVEARQKRLAELILANDRSLAQSRIDIMDDGKEKELKIIDLWLEAQKEAIESARQQMLEIQGLSPEDSLDQETEDKFLERQSNAEKEAENRRAQTNEKYTRQEMERYAALLSQYADYDEKRREIDERYEADRKALEEKYASTGDERYSNALSVLNSRQERELNALEMAYDKVYEKIFRDPSKMTEATIIETLELARKKLAELSKTAEDGTLIDPESVKALQDAITNLEQARDSNPFEGWDNSIKGVFEKMYNIKKTKEDINRYTEEGNEKAAGEASALLEKQKEDLAKSLISTGANEFANALSAAADSMQQIAEATGDVQLSEMASQLGAFAQNLSAAAQGLASGSWVGAVIGGISDMVNQTMDAFTTAKLEAAEAKKNLQDFRHELELMSLAVDETKYDGIFGTDEIGKASEALGKAKAAMEEYKETMDELNSHELTTLYESKKNFISLGAGIFAPIFGAKGFEKTMSEEMKGALEAYENGYSKLEAMQVKTKDRSGWANFWGKKDEYTSLKDLAPELWDENGEFNIEAAKVFLETNTQINQQQRDQIQNVIDLKEAYDDALELVDSYLEDLYGSWGDDIADAISEGIINGTDAFDVLDEKAADVIRNIGKQMLYSTFFKGTMDSFTESLRDAVGDPEEMARLTAAMVEALAGKYDEAQEWLTDFYGRAGELGIDVYSGNASEQTASSRGFQAMSQDVGEELNGRATDIQGKVTEIRDYVIMLTQNNSLCLNETINIRDIMIQMNGNVSDIRTYTSVLPEMRDTMARMNRKLDEI